MTRRWPWSAIRRARRRPRCGEFAESPPLAAGVAGWAVLVVDAKGHVVHADEQVHEVSGYHAADLAGRHLSYLYPSSSGTGAAAALERAKRHGIVQDEGWQVRRDGSWFWAAVVILPHARMDGSVAGFCVLVADLTAPRNHQAQLRAVEEVNEAVRDGLGRDIVLSTVARNARELLGVAACAVMTVEVGGDLLVRATNGAMVRDLWGTWVSGHDTPEAEAVRTQRPLTVPDQATGEGLASPLAAPGARSALLVPVPGQGRSVGLIEAADDTDRRFTAEDVRTVGLFLAQVGIDVEQTRAAGAIERLGTVVTPGARPLPGTLDELVCCVVETCGAVAAVLYVVGDDGCLRLMARHGDPEAGPGTEREVASRATPEAAHATRSTVVEPGLVCVPLLSRDSSVGVLCCRWPGQSRPGVLELAYVSLIAAQAAVAVDTSQRWKNAADKAALNERHRLARELHDSVSQALYSIGLGARTVRELLGRDPGQAEAPVDYIVQLAEAGLAELRALVFELRPEGLAEEGLVAALDKQVAALGSRYDMDTHAALGPEPAVDMDTKRALYRIAQEALQNVTRHAQARHVAVRMNSGPTDVVLEISDDGVGFDPTASFPGHFGLASMRERISEIGGDLDISSARDTGTRVRARAPVGQWRVINSASAA